MTYYISDGTQKLGPLPVEQLLDRGLQSETLVWREGMPDWRPARDVPELSHLLKPRNGNPNSVPPPPPPPPVSDPLNFSPVTQAEVNSRKIAAGICGILLGSFGVHKFILGFTGTGIIMLVATVATCGVAAAVTHVIGLIEGIVYLTKSDSEFYQRYYVEKQNWF